MVLRLKAWIHPRPPPTCLVRQLSLYGPPVRTRGYSSPLADQIPVDIRCLGVSYLRVVADVSLQQHILPVPDEVGGARRSTFTCLAPHA